MVTVKGSPYTSISCPVQAPIPEQGPTPQFWQFCGLWGPLCNCPLCKPLRGDSKVHSLMLTSCRPFRWVSGATTLAERFVHTGHSLVCSLFCLQYKIHILQVTKLWQWDFGLVLLVAGYCFLYCRAGLIWLIKEARAKLRRMSIQ